MRRFRKRAISAAECREFLLVRLADARLNGAAEISIYTKTALHFYASVAVWDLNAGTIKVYRRNKKGRFLADITLDDLCAKLVGKGVDVRHD